MPHELEFYGGEASFAFNLRRGHPWHRLGTPVLGDMALDTMLAAARADFAVEKCGPVYVRVLTNEGFQEIEIPDTFATVRMTGPTGPEAFRAVGADYTVAPYQWVAELAQDVIGLSKGEACWDTLGVLGRGERFFGYLRFPEIVIDPQGIADVIEHGLAVTSSHDGSTPITMADTDVRTVCANTLRLGLATAKAIVRVKHTVNAEVRLRAAAEAIQMAHRAAPAIVQTAEKLLALNDDGNLLTAVLDELWPLKADMPKRQHTGLSNKRSEVRRLYVDGPLNARRLGRNGWGVFNAVAEWTDWYSPVRGVRVNTDIGRQDHRSEAVMSDGSTVTKVKESALSALLAMAN